MNPILWWRLFAVLAVEAGALTALTALVARRAKSAAWQRTVWQTGVVAFLALVVCEFTGAGRGLWRWAAASEPTHAERSFVVRTFPPTLNAAQPGAAHRATDPADPPAAAKASPATTVWWPGLLWLAGTLLLAGRSGLARGRFLLRWRQRRFLGDESLQSRVALLASRIGLRRRVRVTEAAGLAGPIAFGVFRPSICLPERFADEFTGAQQEAMLAHELAHVAASDPGWYALADLMIGLWWWHPLAWWVRRRLQAASEHAADDASLLVEDGPGTLAECLVIMGRRLSQVEPFGRLGIEGNGFRSSLARRVTRLLDLNGRHWRRPEQASVWLARAAGALTLGTLLFATAAWTARADSDRFTAGGSWQNSPAGRAWTAISRAEQRLLLAQAAPTPAESRGVAPPARAAETPALYTRTFAVDPNTMTKTLAQAVPQATDAARASDQSGADVTARLKVFLAGFGADLGPPKSLFFNQRNGILMVRGTLADLDVIEHAVQALNSMPPQVTIEIRFVELTAEDTRALGFDWFLATNGVAAATTTPPPHDRRPASTIGEPRLQSATNLPLTPVTGILTPAQFRVVLAALEKRRGVNILSAPKVTTLSGRQAQVKAVNVRYVVTDLDLSDRDKIQPMTEPFEFGPVLDVVPYVTADGYRIQMTIIPSVKEFLGYDTNQFQAKSGAATQIVPLPMFRVRQVVASATAWDGQTVVVGPGAIEVEEQPDPAATGPVRKVRKNLVVFVTPTIIDPAGNRAHSEEEMTRRAESRPPSNPVR